MKLYPDDLWTANMDTPAACFGTLAAYFALLFRDDIPLEPYDRRRMGTVFATSIFELAMPFGEGKRAASRFSNVIRAEKREQAIDKLTKQGIKVGDAEEILAAREGVKLETLQRRRSRAKQRAKRRK